MARVLVLNASYEPLSVVTARRAVVLVFNQKASVVVGKDEIWASESEVVEVPSVVRLNRFVKVPYRRAAPVTRRAVFGRDGHRCQYCGAKISLASGTYDHVVPRAQGGKTVWDNIVTACEPCNSRKANRTPAQAGMVLLSKPVQPRDVPIQAFRVSTRSAPEAWRDYLYWNSSLDE